ncbi:MFS general substrate transporter [Penicillium canescens]|uniref:MFS general substrate transporter n=1 Tax=Penicillium canescens TaxID=5083 RepID=A0AAD6IC32_PENCN|nr:MFS general substrate transporter [Penicillium canescens]
MDTHTDLPFSGTDDKLGITVLVEPETPSPISLSSSEHALHSSDTTLHSSDSTLWDIHLVQHAKVASQPANYSARQWGIATKVLISIVAIASFFEITLANSIYIAGIPGIRAEFQIGSTLAISPVTLYAMGFTIGPLLSSALSEEFGRQWAIKCSLLLYLVFTIVCTTASNFRTLAVAGAISGIFGSPLVTIFVGVLNDFWKMPEDRLAVPIFPYFCSLDLESVVDAGGWRWTFRLIAVLASVCFLAALPIAETYEPEVRRKAIGSPRHDWRKVVGPALLRPLHMLWVEPIIFPTTSITVAGQLVLFVFYAAFPIMLNEVYGFSPYQTGLAFLAQLAAGFVAFPVMGFVEKKDKADKAPWKKTRNTFLSAAS